MVSSPQTSAQSWIAVSSPVGLLEYRKNDALVKLFLVITIDSGEAVREICECVKAVVPAEVVKRPRTVVPH